MNKLKELCLQITDGEHGSLANAPGSSFYFLNNNNITAEGVVIRSGDREISKANFVALRKRTHLAMGDVVIATCGTLGKSSVIHGDPSNFDFSRSVGIIKPDTSKLLGDYLHYYLSLSSSQKRIQQIATGGVQKHFYIEDMENFDIVVPSIDVQRAAVSVLKTVDNKIALNRNLMAELEETARLIYDYWFVQFDFPDENGNPYRSSGGKMVYNETLKREIPDGWLVGEIRDLGTIVSGATPSTNSPDNYASNGIAWITPNDLSNLDSSMYIGHGMRDISETGLGACSATLMPRGSVIMSSRAPIGYLAIAVNECCTNQGCKSLVANLGYGSYFVYFTLQHLMPRIKAQGSGTTFTEVSKDVLGKMPLPLPPIELAGKYENAITESCGFIERAKRQSGVLKALRDWLLSMLMNGQVIIRG